MILTRPLLLFLLMILFETSALAQQRRASPSTRQRQSQVQSRQTTAPARVQPRQARQRNRPAAAAQERIAVSTIYYIPHIRDYCPNARNPRNRNANVPCPAFLRQVRMQGSGTLHGNRIRTYLGRTLELGDCNTAFGAANRCLTPFISVAADPAHYNMGDIIEMPSMRGKTIRLPEGQTMIHPGYFIVQDSGGEIKGPNRFDFFTGSYGPSHPENIFGYRGPSDTRMHAASDRSRRKRFTRIQPNSPGYAAALAAIDSSTGSNLRVAQTSNSARRGTN